MIDQNEIDLERKATDIIHDLGIPAHLRGYRYIRSAIMLVVKDVDMLNGVTKRLYPAVAEEHNTTSLRAERAIRNAIDVAWGKRMSAPMINIFDLGGERFDKPTNSEFIATVADRLRLEMKGAAQ